MIGVSHKPFERWLAVLYRSIHFLSCFSQKGFVSKLYTSKYSNDVQLNSTAWSGHCWKISPRQTFLWMNEICSVFWVYKLVFIMWSMNCNSQFEQPHIWTQQTLCFTLGICSSSNILDPIWLKKKCTCDIFLKPVLMMINDEINRLFQPCILKALNTH